MLALAAVASHLGAQTLSGTIRINRTLTHKSVTAAVPVYQRGPSAKLANIADEAPLDFERSHVLVYLEGALPASPADSRGANAAMRQEGRQFQPDLVIIPAGGSVSFPNMDPIFHNVFSLSHLRNFDLGSYDRGDARRITFPKPGIESVYCHLHPNMTATIFVAPNRWFAQADRAGHFQIRDVPPGNYTVVAWHKAVGSFRQPIHIEAGRDASVTFTLPFSSDRELAMEQEPMPPHDTMSHEGRTQGSR